MEILRTENLTKYYGKIKALDNLNLRVEQGQIMGILGPNGSGKTTTLGIILDVLKATSGSFTWFENTYGAKHRYRIGSILETPNFFPYLNADQNLDIVRKTKLLNPQSFDEVLDFVKLKARRQSKFKTYSLGMKQRLAIAATLIGDPDVVIFDEPTNGLDPEGIAEVRQTLIDVAGRGKTVIMASHILDEVEKICSHVTIIKSGKLLASGSVGSILSDDITIELGCDLLENLEQYLTQIEDIKSMKRVGNLLECQANKSVSISALNAALVNDGFEITHLVSRKKKLEEEFLAITSQS